MANVITLARLLLLFVLVAMTYWAPPPLQLLDAPLLIVIIALDGLDGYIARRRGETSVFGSLFDIAVDRVVENVLWIVLGHLGLLPIWVAIVFVVRGALVDTIRHAMICRGETVSGMMHTPLGHTLVASRWMRGLYGTIKALTFAWVLFWQPWPALQPLHWAAWSQSIDVITLALVVAATALCLLRGLPVIGEFLIACKASSRTHLPVGN